MFVYRAIPLNRQPSGFSRWVEGIRFHAFLFEYKLSALHDSSENGILTNSDCCTAVRSRFAVQRLEHSGNAHEMRSTYRVEAKQAS